MADSPSLELKSSLLYILILVFASLLDFGSFHFEVLFRIFLSNVLNGFCRSLFLAAFRVRRLHGNFIFFVAPPPHGHYSRVTTKVRPAPPVGGQLGHTVCCLSLVRLLHDLTTLSHHFIPFYVYIFTHAPVHARGEGSD